MVFKKFFLVSGLFLIFSLSSFALDIKLHKEVKLPFRPYNPKYAEKSGHLILKSLDDKRIVVYDHKGNIIFQWGPTLDRYSRYIDMADNGIFIFESGKPYYEDIKIHYCKGGKEIWVKDLAGHGYGIGRPFISPDGSYIIATSDMETGDEGIVCFNSRGEKLWHKHKDIEFLANMELSDFDFSPDSRYFCTTSAHDGTFYLFNSSGDLILKRKYASGFVRGQYLKLMPFDYDHLFSYLPKPPESELPKEGIYDLKGNLITTLDGMLTIDGTRLVRYIEDKLVILEFPSLAFLMEYPFDYEDVEISEDLRFLFGEKNGKLYVLDTKTNSTAETSLVNGFFRWISYNGKYIIFLNLEERKAWFYELIY